MPLPQKTYLFTSSGGKRDGEGHGGIFPQHVHFPLTLEMLFAPSVPPKMPRFRYCCPCPSLRVMYPVFCGKNCTFVMDPIIQTLPCFHASAEIDRGQYCLELSKYDEGS